MCLYAEDYSIQHGSRAPQSWGREKPSLRFLYEDVPGRCHYREALKERTCERVPLDWAGTQMNLGTALARLGEREIGTGKLEEAVTAFNACLALTTPVWPPDWVRFVKTSRDATLAEIMRRSAKTRASEHLSSGSGATGLSNNGS